MPLLNEGTDCWRPVNVSFQPERPPPAERKRRLWTWLAWIYLASLIAAKALWVTTAYY